MQEEIAASAHALHVLQRLMLSGFSLLTLTMDVWREKRCLNTLKPRPHPSHAPLTLGMIWVHKHMQMKCYILPGNCMLRAAVASKMQ